MGAREEHRTASKALAIRFHAGRDRAPRLRAFDHDYTQLEPPCFSFALAFAAGRRSVRLHLPLRRQLTPTDPDRLSCTSDSGDVLQGLGNALLDRLGGLYRSLLSEIPKFLVLRGCDIEVLTLLHGGKRHDYRQRLRAQKIGKKIESGGGVDTRDLDDFDPVVRGALRVGRIGLSENVGHFSRGGLHLLAVFLHPHDAVLSDATEDP